MNTVDVDADLELLMRHWHVTTEWATGAWAEYEALRSSLPASHRRVTEAHARWRAAEHERRELMQEIEAAEESQAA